MKQVLEKCRSRVRPRAWLPLAILTLALPAGVPAATQSAKMPVVFKWGRVDQAFKSSFAYSNALQQATLTVTFTSPLGQTSQATGFWDGGKTWRVRFAVNEVGRWTFKSSCSDPANNGLNNQTGQFLCTAEMGFSRFEKHGPVRVAQDHRHFEHADGTPFFWMADTAWDGARLSQPKSWETYSVIRADQNFTVVQWSVAPGEDLKGQWAFSFSGPNVVINPAFFKRLDAKVDTLKHAGLLSAISPLSELEAQNLLGMTLTDDEAVLVVRYIAARYGADPVAWLLALDGDNHEQKAARWKRIGQAAFGKGPHAPVILYSGKTEWFLDAFRDQNWVDAFGYQTLTDATDDAVKSMLAGPFADEWKKDPPRPLIPFTPIENTLAPSKARFSAADVRRAGYSCLLMTPPAGVAYGAQGVATWDTSVEKVDSQERKATPAAAWPLWQKSLFLSGAKGMKNLAAFMGTMDFWRLRPNQSVVATQPGDASPRRTVVAAATESKREVVVYIPEDRTVELSADALPPSPIVMWSNPRTGVNSPAVAVVGGSVCQFPTPEAGDWLLMATAGK